MNLRLAMVLTALLALGSAASADDVLGESPFLRILGDLSSQLDPDAPKGPPPGQAGVATGTYGPRRPTAALTRISTTVNFRYCFMGAGRVIVDDNFGGAVEYKELWSHVAGGDVNLNFNIIPFLSIFVAGGFEYLLPLGPHDFGDPVDGTWEAEKGFVMPVLVGVKLNIPFLEPPANWFNPQTSMVRGPLARIRVAGGFNFISDMGIKVSGGSKDSPDPYTLWDNLSMTFTIYVGLGIEYKIQERLTFFFEFGVQSFLSPDDHSDMNAIFKNPNTHESENLYFFPVFLGVTYGF
jgi:hypothetical protein